MGGITLFVHFSECEPGKQPKEGDILTFQYEPRRRVGLGACGQKNHFLTEFLIVWACCWFSHLFMDTCQHCHSSPCPSFLKTNAAVSSSGRTIPSSTRPRASRDVQQIGRLGALAVALWKALAPIREDARALVPRAMALSSWRMAPSSSSMWRIVLVASQQLVTFWSSTWRKVRWSQAPRRPVRKRNVMDEW